MRPMRSTTLDADFAQRRARAPRLSWLLLVAGVAAGTIAAIEAQRGLEALRALQAQAGQVAQRIERVRAAGRPAQRSAADRVADSALRGDAERIERDLNRRWSQVLDALEADGSPEVKLVQLSFDEQFKRAQVQIEAKTLGDVFRYTQRLAAAEQIGAVTLVQHEWRDAPGLRVISARIAVDAGSGARTRAARPSEVAAAPAARGRP